ncbi:MAG: DNA-binding transcriptional LysR family regulator [Gammaproteobacteria bacterium]|jgi:DNA-binding transcriptional LysR family regulator
MHDWNDLQYILALDEGGTMKQAARLLGTNATTVSRHVKRLSAEHGVMLFSGQKGGNWVITEEGKTLLRLAKYLNKKLHSLDLASSESRQIIKITSMDFILAHYLAPRLGDAFRAFPDTEIHLLSADRQLSLAYGEADIDFRFDRPEEGNLLASKVATIQYNVWSAPGTKPKDWIGLGEDLDWTPEMKFGREYFGRPPIVRMSKFVAVRRGAISAGLGSVGPSAVMKRGGCMAPIVDAGFIRRDIWCVIHEPNKLNQRLAEVRSWAKAAVIAGSL